MQAELQDIIPRKITATFISAFFPASVFTFWYIYSDIEASYNQGNDFIGWFFIYFMYAFVIIFLYGNFVSIAAEFLQRKYFPTQDWLYVIIVSSLGAFFGILTINIFAAATGFLAALVYAVLDKMLFKDVFPFNMGWFFLMPIVVVGLIWGCLQIASPQMPAFTEADAVDFLMEGAGTDISYFPKEIGKWEGAVNGYQVTRETKAKKIKKDIYLVIFIEKWKKENEKGQYIISNKVDRNSVFEIHHQGDYPPYYK
ncbi:hypothetical protein [Niallia sp. NCCP-28]|uniref:hypothetical protein n=1 Tax=Niallia sp. NCCP-28 TaxID=2934712 RepID=UPI00207E75B2|nr:hypothetical protein [Niallia sp. NCCP-28]GKU80631.1 hypothetical protein NCCP28_00270 [Niallia sp. NCCP-28]